MVTNINAMLIGPPTLIISIILIPAASYAIALGHAETGSIKVKEEANAAGRHRRRGLIQRFKK